MAASNPDRLIVGTRGSLLARAQTDRVVEAIRAANVGLEVRVEIIRTTGDRKSHQPLPEVGGKGLFTLELEQALHDGAIDLAVHSAKDLPTDLADGLTVLAVPAREDVRDALISRDNVKLDDLPRGATIGTSSLRRQAQLLMRRSDLRFTTLRGNIDTRIVKVRRGDCDATLLAMAGLNRAGLTEAVTEPLEIDMMLPAPGQGALALEGRRDDERVRALLVRLHDTQAAAALTCERRLIASLDAGCLAPIGALARCTDDTLHVEALVAMPNGTRFVRAAATGPVDDAVVIGEGLAERLRAQGADAIIAACRPNA